MVIALPLASEGVVDLPRHFTTAKNAAARSSTTTGTYIHRSCAQTSTLRNERVAAAPRPCQNSRSRMISPTLGYRALGSRSRHLDRIWLSGCGMFLSESDAGTA